MNVLDKTIEEVFTEERTKSLGFSNRMRLEFMQSMRWDNQPRIRTITDLVNATPFRLLRRPGFGKAMLRYVKAVLASVEVDLP